MNRKYLRPGDYYITNKAMILETLVGSCVSVCLYNGAQKLAGMNHFLLDYADETAVDNIGKYGSTSMDYLITEMLKVDPVRSHIHAQVFGGAAIFKGKSKESGSVGRQNIKVALEYLHKYGLKISRQEIGGNRGRRLYFNTTDNTVTCRFAGDIPRKKKK